MLLDLLHIKMRFFGPLFFLGQILWGQICPIVHVCVSVVNIVNVLLTNKVTVPCSVQKFPQDPCGLVWSGVWALFIIIITLSIFLIIAITISKIIPISNSPYSSSTYIQFHNQHQTPTSPTNPHSGIFQTPSFQADLLCWYQARKQANMRWYLCETGTICVRQSTPS